MNHPIRTTIGCLCLLVLSTISCLAKEWRGIVPLHSTRSDVLSLLGNPKHSQLDYSEYFEVNGDKVTFEWIDPTCHRQYPVYPDQDVQPQDLVLNISVSLKRAISLDELGETPSKIYMMHCSGNNWCVFWDEKEGFAYTTSELGVTGLSYSPTKEEFKEWSEEHQGCVSSRQKSR